MSFLREFAQRPQQVWLRRAMFQVHLWLGLFLVVYVVLIGVSGSILVLRQEFQQWTGLNPNFGPIRAGGPRLGFAAAVSAIQAQYPKAQIGFLYPPRSENPAYYALVRDGRNRLAISVHPYTGAILKAETPSPNWLTWVGQLHYFLLLGPSPGLWLNGVGSALLLVMTVSGMVLWWPGIRQWMRAFVIDFRRSWKRIIWDSHNVVGFWTLSIVAFWAISGVYLVWPQEFTAAVNRISPVSIEGARERRVQASENKTGRVNGLEQITAEAPGLIPGSHVGAVSFPAAKTAPLMLYMVRDGRESLSGADFIYYDSATGQHLKTSLRNNPQSFGDWVIWSMRPFHFGTHWGLEIKILWFILGLALPFLAVTGVVMYWNRYLGRKWRQLTNEAGKVPARERQTA